MGARGRRASDRRGDRCAGLLGRPQSLIVDEQLKILWVNALASELLRRKGEVEDRYGVLALEDPVQHACLLALLRKAGTGLITHCTPLSAGSGHLLVRARRLECGESVLIAIQITRTDSGDHDVYHDLDLAFGLTPAEHRVLLSLLSGNEADRVTRTLGVSMDTVRSHIRNIYAKLGVSSREQLFVKVQPFRV
jgi:DNA-binding CsgD family transcriptional regulator